MWQKAQSKKEKPLLKIFSWHINGLKSVCQHNNFQNFLEEYEPDILCLTKSKEYYDDKQTKSFTSEIPDDYEQYWNWNQ